MGNATGRRTPPAPPPPPGLSAALPNDWLNSWRAVRVQPQVDVPAWDGAGCARVTPSVKGVGLFAATFATWETGADVRPGVDVLAAVTGYSTKAVGQALEAACRLGFLWQYVKGSQGGRPGQGRRPLKSTYLLTVPDDILSGRVPLIGEQENSDQENSDHLISDPGSPELSSTITRPQFALPLQDPLTTPDITVVSHSAASVEVRRPGPDQEKSVRVIASPLMAAVPDAEAARCDYDGCLAPAATVGGDGYHDRCRYLSGVKARGTLVAAPGAMPA